MPDDRTTKPAEALADLIQKASDPAAANWVETFRNDLAAFGTLAVDGVRPWLSDPILGPRAVTVLERAAALHGARIAAGRVFRAALKDPDVAVNWSLIRGAMERLRMAGTPTPGPAKDYDPLPPGTHVAPPWDVKHHVIADHVGDVPVYGGDVYLFYCGRFFSGGWVRASGGILEPAGRPICELCRTRMAEGTL